MKTLLPIALAAVLLPSVVFAQSTADRTLGISVGLQSDTTAIRLPIWLSEGAVLTPAVSFVQIGESGRDIGVGLQIRRNFTEDANRFLVPYVALNANGLFFVPEEGSTLTDTVFGFALGGESFLNDALSIGVEAQINAAFSDENSGRFGAAGETAINTGTQVFVAVYF